jgi:hypothetical protein
MSRIIGAAGAAVLGLSLVVGSVLPGFAQRGAIEQDPDIYFDLGIDATLLPQDAAGAKAYLAKQPADTQRVLRAACDNYVKHPADAEMPQTVKFCQFILAK